MSQEAKWLLQLLIQLNNYYNSPPNDSESLQKANYVGRNGEYSERMGKTWSQNVGGIIAKTYWAFG